jgi:hypothetical protein
MRERVTASWSIPGGSWTDTATGGWVRWLAHPVTEAFLTSRLVALGALLVGGTLHEGRASTAGLTAWDGHWYLLIVRSGYGSPPAAHQWSRWPFFPLLPASARLLGIVGVPPRWALITVANATFIVALAGVWRLATAGWNRRVAIMAVWLAAVAPFASVFSMAYPSSLLLAGSAWAFVFLRENRYLAAGVAAVVATLARPNGVALIVALGVAVWCQARSSPVDGERRPTARRLVTVCGPGVAALALWCIELWRRTGDPVVFWTAKRAWFEVTLLGLIQSWPGDAVTHLSVGLIGLALVVLAWRQLPTAWVVFAVLYLVPSFGFGLVGLGRYTGECFPVLLAAALFLGRAPRLVPRAVLAASAVAMASLAVVITTEGIIP